MKGIDLTKCRNEMATVRFWVQEKKEYTTFGRIEPDKGGWGYLASDEDVLRPATEEERDAALLALDASGIAMRMQYE